MTSNLNNSMAAMMNTRIQQPSPSVLNSALNQNNSIDDILAQQQNFAKNYNNSTALSKSPTSLRLWELMRFSRAQL